MCLQRRISLTVRDLCMKFSMGTPSRTSRHGFVEMHHDQESIHTLAAGATRGAGGMNSTKLDACQFASAICARLCGAVLTMERMRGRMVPFLSSKRIDSNQSLCSVDAERNLL